MITCFLFLPVNGCIIAPKPSELTRDKPNFYIPNYIDKRFFKSFKKQTAKEILEIESSEIDESMVNMVFDRPKSNHNVYWINHFALFEHLKKNEKESSNFNRKAKMLFHPRSHAI